MLISEFKDRIGVSRPDVENWTSRLQLWTEYAPTRPGVARSYSRENVLELAILAALVRAGCVPRTAASYAASVIRNDRMRSGKAWYAFPAGDFTSGIGTDNPSGVDFTALAAMSPNQAVSLIHVAKIVETVDQLFANREGG